MKKDTTIIKKATSKEPKKREHDDCHPAFILLPPGRPLAECSTIKKEGGWGH